MTDLWICVHALCPPWEISRDNGSNSTRKFAHSLKFEVFEIISLIGLVFSTMAHYTCELFCCLACDCNYRDEKLCDVNFTSRLFCTRQILFSKLLDVLEVFWNFTVMYIQIETLCAQSLLIKSKGRNIKWRCYCVLQHKTAILGQITSKVSSEKNLKVYKR